MAKGSSGRIVIVVEPELKRELYVELARRSLTLKDWFIAQATTYLETSNQLQLFVMEELGSQKSNVSGDIPSSTDEDS